MEYETLTVTEEGENATLTGTREEILELLSYGTLWSSALRREAEHSGATLGAECWHRRYTRLNRLFRTIAR